MVTPAVSVIIVRNKKVLLVKHKEESKHPTGIYGLPGGKKEEYESFEDAAVREVEEETGLRIDRESLIFIGKYEMSIERKVGEEQASMMLYACEKFKGRLKKGAETEPVWASIEDFLFDKYPIPRVTGNFVPEVKKVLNSYLQNQQDL